MNDDELDSRLKESHPELDITSLQAPFVAGVMTRIGAARRRRRVALCSATLAGSVAAVAGVVRAAQDPAVGLAGADVGGALVLAAACAVAWMGSDEWAAPQLPAATHPGRQR